MALVPEGSCIDGGIIRIRFPHMEVEMSVDNETELASAIEMLKKALELYEVEKAKTLLIMSDEERERKKLVEEHQKRIEEMRRLTQPAPPPLTTYPSDPPSIWTTTTAPSIVGSTSGKY